MLKPKMTPLIFVFLFSLSFQIAAQSQQKTASAGTATISGRVVLKGEPARNVLVYLRSQRSPAPSNPDAISRARTDESGQFRITGVAAGVYIVVALAPGFTSSDVSQPGFRGKTLNVSEGENVENIDIEIKRGGIITGRVIDSQGRPLVEERVALSRLDKNGQSQQNFYFSSNFEMFQTDDRGVYRIHGVPEGRYRISVGVASSAGSGIVSGGGTFYPRTFHPDVANESEAKVIEVTEGSENDNIDIAVPEALRTRTVSGRVVNAETGQPVAGIEITCGAMSEDGRYITSWGWDGSRSRANGEFHLKGMAPGKYAIFARTESDSEFFSEPVTCDLSDGDVGGIEIKVRQGGSISGVVVIEGTNDPKVLAKLPRLYLYVNTGWTQSSVPRRDEPKVNADGSFRIRGLQQGKVDIGYYPRPDDRGFSLARVEYKDAPARDGIEVGAGEHVTGVRVVLAYGTFALRGEVKITGGALILPAGQRLYASVRRTDQPAQTPTSQGAEVDTRGQFVIESLAPGEYEVMIRPVMYSGADRIDQRIMKAFSSVRERVIVNSDNQRVTIAVDLSPKEEDK